MAYSDRSLDSLAEPVKQAAIALLGDCRVMGIELLIYCTLRSCDEQARLYALGRTVPGRIVTCARPGMSKHNPDKLGKAWAFDAVPTICGKPQWADKQAYLKVGVLAEKRGLVWAGRWTGALKEQAHFQI
jgi:peptidoglycan LD-endopeptidase CwlK